MDAASARVEGDRRRAARRHVLGRVGLYGGAITAALVAALPFVWGTITALKQDADLYNADNAPFVFNLAPTFEHVSFLFRHAVRDVCAEHAVGRAARRRDHARRRPARRLQPRHG